MHLLNFAELLNYSFYQINIVFRGLLYTICVHFLDEQHPVSVPPHVQTTQSAQPQYTQLGMNQLLYPGNMQQLVVLQRPNYKPPHTYLILTMVVLLICAMLNITSIVFGVPALVMAIMVSISKDYN